LIYAGPDQTVCTGNPTTFIATGTVTTFIWSPPTGLSATNIFNPIASPLITTEYYVTGTDSHNCTNSDSVLVTVAPIPTAFFKGPASSCVPLTATFTDSSFSNITNWLWNFGDVRSDTANVSALQNPQHKFNHAGTYSITLTVTSVNGCKATWTDSNIITVYPYPVANFTFNPIEGNVTLQPNINFYDRSTNADNWSWNFGDTASGSNDTSSLQNPVHIYTDAQSYTIWLIVTSKIGCIDSISKEIIIDQEFTFFAPNAFTPDDGANNMTFIPKGIGWDLNHFVMYIFDRWGEQIYETHDVNKPWDGHVQGSNVIAQMDVYTWLVILNDYKENQHKFVGRVTLIK